MSDLSDTSMEGSSTLSDSTGMLSVNLHEQFGSFQLAVEFRVPLGLIVLFGASGAGKSLTLRGLAGLLHPKEGHVAVDGHLLFDSAVGIDLPPQERRVGYVPQHYALFPHLTVAENVGFALPRRSHKANMGRFLQGESWSGEGTEGTGKNAALRRASSDPTLNLIGEGTEGTRKGDGIVKENPSGGRTEGYLSPRQDSRKGPHLFPQPPLPLQAGSVSFLRVPWGRERAIRKERVAELLRALGLEGLEGRYPGTLSGGQQQRVALARALAAEPRLLLLDEPFNALDVAVREHLRDTLKQFQRKFGVPIVLVTHDHAEAQQLADTIVVLQKGWVVQVGGAEEIFFAPRTRDIARLVGQRNVFHGHLVASEEKNSPTPSKALKVDWLQLSGAEEGTNISSVNHYDNAWLPLPVAKKLPSSDIEGSFTGCILADEMIVQRWSETSVSLPTWTAGGAVQWKGVVLDAQLQGHVVRLLVRPEWTEQLQKDRVPGDGVLELYLSRGRWREVEVDTGQPVLLEIGPEAIHLFGAG